MGKNPTFLEQAKHILSSGRECPGYVFMFCKQCIIYNLRYSTAICSPKEMIEISKKYLRIQKLKRILSL